MSIEPAPQDFHAQRDASKKRYEYRIYTGPVLPPFLHGYVHHMTRPLNIPDMQEAGEQLCLSHDFRGFAAASTRVKSTVRTVFLSRIQKQGCHLTYQIEGDGFLHHMVRNIVGTLLEIGVGKRAPDDIYKILASKDRRLAGPTAPAHGLYLMHIWY